MLGGALSFRQLLHNLEHLCNCTVAKLADGGIPDTDGSVSGDFYEVTRTIPGLTLYTHIEVYRYEQSVLPEHLDQICADLGLPHSWVRGRPN